MCNTQRARKGDSRNPSRPHSAQSAFLWTVKVLQYPHDGELIPQCAGRKEYAFLVEKVWPWVDTIVYSLLPFVIIMVLNILIIRQVLIARRHRNELPFGSMYEQRRPSHEGSTRLTVMLLTISFAFLLTTLPMNIVNHLGCFP